MRPINHENVPSHASAASPDPYRAWRFRDFRLLTSGRAAALLGEAMVNVAIGWELYQRTNSVLALGSIGLAQLLPALLLSLPAGHIADRFDGKRITQFTQLGVATGVFGLALLSYYHGPLLLVYGCLLEIGAVRTVYGPASSVLLRETVLQEAVANATSWDSSVRQLAAVLGPALGGWLITISRGALPVYVSAATVSLIYVLSTVVLPRCPRSRSNKAPMLTSLVEGVHYLRSSKPLIAAMTLDLFAVLLGGATALLPVYARDILRVGPTELGWLRAAPSVGAILIAIVLAYQPPFRRPGRALLLVVTGFGLATVAFGLSHSFVLSLALLGGIGALDNISVVIRSTLLLTQPSNNMLGRIGAINWVFTGTANQLGGVESGVAAALLGPVVAVVSGGVGTVLVVALVAFIWPELRRLEHLNTEA